MRRFLSRLCLCLFLLTVTSTQVLWWVSHTLLDTSAFSDSVARVVSDPQVQQDLASEVNSQLGLAGLSPQQQAEVDAAVLAIVQDPAFGTELTRTAATYHGALVSGSDPAASLDLSGLQDLVRDGLVRLDPRLAGQIPEDPPQPDVALGNTLPEIAPLASGLRAAIPWLVLAAVLLVTLAVAASRDRARTLRWAGILLLVSIAITVLLGLLAPMVLLGSVPPGTASSVGGALLSVLLATMVGPLVAVVIAGLALLAAGLFSAAYQRGERPEPQPAPVQVSSVPLAAAPYPPSGGAPAPWQAPAPVPSSPPPPPRPPGPDDEDNGGWGRLRY